MVGGGGILLIIDILAFPWHSNGPFSLTGTDTPGPIWAVLALLVTLVVVIDLALERFSPSTVIPTTQLGRAMTRAAAAGVALVMVLFKLILPSHGTDFLGWGFYLGIILAVAIVVGAWMNAQGRSTSA
jgi:hypothetical protein